MSAGSTLSKEVLVASLVVAGVPLVLLAVATALDGDEDLRVVHIS